MINMSSQNIQANRFVNYTNNSIKTIDETYRNVPLAKNFVQKLSTLFTLKGITPKSFFKSLNDLKFNKITPTQFYYSYIELFNGTISLFGVNIKKKGRESIDKWISRKVDSFKGTIRRTYEYLQYSPYPMWNQFGKALYESYTQKPKKPLKLKHKYQKNQTIVVKKYNQRRKGFITKKSRFYIYKEKKANSCKKMMNVNCFNVNIISKYIISDILKILKSNHVNNIKSLNFNLIIKYELCNGKVYNKDSHTRSTIIRSNINLAKLEIFKQFNGFDYYDKYGQQKHSKGIFEIFKFIGTSQVYHIYKSTIILNSWL